jgi:hypothetical protein
VASPAAGARLGPWRDGRKVLRARSTPRPGLDAQTDFARLDGDNLNGDVQAGEDDLLMDAASTSTARLLSKRWEDGWGEHPSPLSGSPRRTTDSGLAAQPVLWSGKEYIAAGK